MDNDMQNLLEAVQNLIFRCEEHDRPNVYENENKVCKFRSGWATGFHLYWDDNKYTQNVSCYLSYSDVHIGSLHISDEKPLADTMFLTKKIFREELIPALESWLAQKVSQDEYGGMYSGAFGVSMTFDLGPGIDEPEDARRWIQGAVRVKNQNKLDAAREAVRQFILSREYVKADLDSDEYYACVKFISQTACDFLEELGADTLKEFFETTLENAKKGHFAMSHVVQGMNTWSYLLLNKDETPTDVQLDFACFTSLKALMHATDKYEYGAGSDTLKSAAAKGSKLAKDIMKFGSGLIDKQYTYHKDKQVECIANDVKQTVDIKIKQESAEVYETAVRFLTKLLRQGFPRQYQIKCNTKVKQYIDTELKNTKTNNFFANAAAYPQVHGALRDYYSAAFDEYSYYADATDELAVTCGGYAAMALAFADPVGNFDIGLDFLESSDFEHAITSRYFAQDFANVCEGENKEKILPYLEEC